MKAFGKIQGIIRVQSETGWRNFYLCTVCVQKDTREKWLSKSYLKGLQEISAEQGLVLIGKIERLRSLKQAAISRLEEQYKAQTRELLDSLL